MDLSQGEIRDIVEGATWVKRNKGIRFRFTEDVTYRLMPDSEAEVIGPASKTETYILEGAFSRDGLAPLKPEDSTQHRLFIHFNVLFDFVKCGIMVEVDAAGDQLSPEVERTLKQSDAHASGEHAHSRASAEGDSAPSEPQ